MFTRTLCESGYELPERTKQRFNKFIAGTTTRTHMMRYSLELDWLSASKLMLELFSVEDISREVVAEWIRSDNRAILKALIDRPDVLSDRSMKSLFLMRVRHSDLLRNFIDNVLEGDAEEILLLAIPENGIVVTALANSDSLCRFPKATGSILSKPGYPRTDVLRSLSMGNYRYTDLQEYTFCEFLRPLENDLLESYMALAQLGFVSEEECRGFIEKSSMLGRFAEADQMVRFMAQQFGTDAKKFPRQAADSDSPSVETQRQILESGDKKALYILAANADNLSDEIVMELAKDRTCLQILVQRGVISTEEVTDTIEKILEAYHGD